MDDLKTFAATKTEAEQSLETATRVSKAVGMEMGHSKCAIAHLRRSRPAAVTNRDGINPATSCDVRYVSITCHSTGLWTAKGALKQIARKEFLRSARMIWSSALNVHNKIRAYNWGPEKVMDALQFLSIRQRYRLVANSQRTAAMASSRILRNHLAW